jgi:hypothetical protein
MNTLFSRLLFAILFISASFNLFAHVELDNPKGGETFTGGSAVTVQWHITISHVTLNWDLLISTDGGATWDFIQENIPAGESSFQWLVPNLNSTQIRISIIQDNEGQDYQDESNDFTIESITSIPTIPENYLQVYPNPVADVLTIDLSNNQSWPAQLEMIDATGNSVWKVIDASKVTRMSVNSYPSGLYFLQIETSQGITTRKFIIQKF